MTSNLRSFSFNNLGPLKQVKCDQLGPINVLIGPNRCGKSFVLKTLYSAIYAIERTGRGDDKRTGDEVLSDKLSGCFRPSRLKDIVYKDPELKPSDRDNELAEIVLSWGNEPAESPDADATYSFQIPASGKNGAKVLRSRSSYSGVDPLFVPPKEVLSNYRTILGSRETLQLDDYDDTYYDLAVALRSNTVMGRNNSAFAQGRRSIEEIIGGRIYQKESGDWELFMKQLSKRTGKNSQFYFTPSLMAEGVKKIGIFDTLLGNKKIQNGSVVIIDEPETALHPDAISKFMKLIHLLATEMNIQFFIATHSYFVLHQLWLLVRDKSTDIPLIDVGHALQSSGDSGNSGNYVHNLKDEYPDTSIDQEVVQLYRESIGLERKPKLYNL